MAGLQIDSEDRRLSNQTLCAELSPSHVNFSRLSSIGDRDDTKAHLSLKGLCSICFLSSRHPTYMRLLQCTKNSVNCMPQQMWPEI